MGLQVSHARTAVNNVVNAGIKVIVEQVQDSTNTTVSGQSIDLTKCSHVVIKNISMKQFLVVKFSVVLSQMSQTDVQAKIKQAIQAAAEAEAKGGLGLQGSDAEVAINAMMNINELIQSTAKSVFSNTVLVTQAINCRDSTDIEVSYIDMSQTSNVVASAIVSQGSFNSAMIDIVNKIDAIASAKSTGYDPFAIMALLAVAVIVGIIVFAMGGSFAGINAAHKMLKSPYFWMSILGVLAAMFAVGVLAEMVGFWPNQKIDNLDKADDAARKKKVNTAVTAVSAVGLVSALGGVGAITYFAIIRPKK